MAVLVRKGMLSTAVTTMQLPDSACNAAIEWRILGDASTLLSLTDQPRAVSHEWKPCECEAVQLGNAVIPKPQLPDGVRTDTL